MPFNEGLLMRKIHSRLTLMEMYDMLEEATSDRKFGLLYMVEDLILNGVAQKSNNSSSQFLPSICKAARWWSRTFREQCPCCYVHTDLIPNEEKLPKAEIYFPCGNDLKPAYLQTNGLLSGCSGVFITRTFLFFAEKNWLKKVVTGQTWFELSSSELPLTRWRFLAHFSLHKLKMTQNPIPLLF